MAGLLAGCGLSPGDTAADEAPVAEPGEARSGLASPIPLSALMKIAVPPGTPHEATPLGVPAGYDWRLTSVLHAGNDVPAGFTAVTGWGHVLWKEDAPLVVDEAIAIRNASTFLCYAAPKAPPRWYRVQAGTIEGAAFSPDYVDNLNVPATIVPSFNSVRVSFSRKPPRAFHFWPLGRSGLSPDPTQTYCGLLFAFQGRAVTTSGQPLASSSLLAGGGADYWLSTTAPWDNYTTNAGLGLGELRQVKGAWSWFGFTTASPETLALLASDGYALPSW
ncbi:MAG: hypothetical protein JNK82_03160 [Myxococcaceae bacterium]|nr:hypothetical protein [Myxococcaceae bacterium]